MGFFGAFSHHATADPSAAWPLAMEAIAKATGCEAKDVRTFLESRQGHRFAEGVIELMSTKKIALKTAVDDAVAKLMCHNLTGMVTNCELEADTGEGRTPPPTFCVALKGRTGANAEGNAPATFSSQRSSLTPVLTIRTL